MTASRDRDQPVTPSVPLSALEHITYCQRQAALIHIDATWTDSADTVRGDLAHRSVDVPARHHRRGVTIIRSLPVHSHALGLHGVCDLVEIDGDHAAPIEYKAGPYRPGSPVDIQLAGQAACLIEAGFTVPTGYVYSAAQRHRHPVRIGDGLLDRMRQAANAMRTLLQAPTLPPARHDTRCRRCSLWDDCLPELTSRDAPRASDLFTPRPLGTWRD